MAAPPNSAPQTKATMATMAIGIPPYARITRTQTPPNSAPHTKAKLGIGIPPIAHRDNAGPPLAVLAEVTPQHRADSGDNPMAIAATAEDLPSDYYDYHSSRYRH